VALWFETRGVAALLTMRVCQPSSWGGATAPSRRMATPWFAPSTTWRSRSMIRPDRT